MCVSEDMLLEAELLNQEGWLFVKLTNLSLKDLIDLQTPIFTNKHIRQLLRPKPSLLLFELFAVRSSIIAQ